MFWGYLNRYLWGGISFFLAITMKKYILKSNLFEHVISQVIIGISKNSMFIADLLLHISPEHPVYERVAIRRNYPVQPY